MDIDALSRIVARREVLVAISALAASARFGVAGAQVETEARGLCQQCDPDHHCEADLFCKDTPYGPGRRCVAADAIVCHDAAYHACDPGLLFVDGKCCRKSLSGGTDCAAADGYCAGL